MERDMSDALEAARRIVNEADDELAGDRAVREAQPGDALTVALAILSLAQGREDVVEECAKVADAAKSESDRLYQSHLERGNYDSMDRCAARAGEARAIAERIRALNSLPSKEGGGST
jgi:hypothetical protein